MEVTPKDTSRVDSKEPELGDGDDKGPAHYDLRGPSTPRSMPDVSAQNLEEAASNDTKPPEFKWPEFDINPSLDDVKRVNLKFRTGDEEVEYMRAIYDKVQLTKEFVLKEQELDLDPDRQGLHKEPVPIALTQGPIKIDMADQQLVRLLLDQTKVLRSVIEAGNEGNVDDEGSIKDYWLYWTELRRSLVVQMPGRIKQDKMSRADKLMKGIFDKLVSDDHENEDLAVD